MGTAYVQPKRIYIFSSRDSLSELPAFLFENAGSSWLAQLCTTIQCSAGLCSYCCSIFCRHTTNSSTNLKCLLFFLRPPKLQSYFFIAFNFFLLLPAMCMREGRKSSRLPSNAYLVVNGDGCQEELSISSFELSPFFESVSKIFDNLPLAKINKIKEREPKGIFVEANCVAWRSWIAMTRNVVKKEDPGSIYVLMIVSSPSPIQK